MSGVICLRHSNVHFPQKNIPLASCSRKHTKQRSVGLLGQYYPWAKSALNSSHLSGTLEWVSSQLHLLRQVSITVKSILYPPKIESHYTATGSRTLKGCGGWCFLLWSSTFLKARWNWNLMGFFRDPPHLSASYPSPRTQLSLFDVFFFNISVSDKSDRTNLWNTFLFLLSGSI